jgi:hypothetical protein
LEHHLAGIDEVKLHVSASVDEVERALVGMRGVAAQFDEAIARLQLITAGTLHPRAMDAVIRLGQAREKLIEAESLARGGIDAAQDYHGII